MIKRSVICLALAVVGCSKDGPGQTASGPIQCGPGTELIDGRCVASDASKTGEATPPATEPAKRDLIAEFEALINEACACPDEACVSAANEKLSIWVKENDKAAQDLDAAEQERAMELAAKLNQCMMAKTQASEEKVDPATVPEDRKKLAADVVAMFESAAAVMKKHENSCDKMAAGLEAIAKKNKAVIDKGTAIRDEPSSNFRRWFDQTYGERLQKVMSEAIESMMKTCGNDDGVRQALQMLTGS